MTTYLWPLFISWSLSDSHLVLIDSRKTLSPNLDLGMTTMLAIVIRELKINRSEIILGRHSRLIHHPIQHFP